jgi:hypothetical protein
MTTRFFKRGKNIAALLCLFGLLAAAPVHAELLWRDSVTRTVVLPKMAFPCLPEDIELTIVVERFVLRTVDNTGVWHYKFHRRPSTTQAVGLDSGMSYAYRAVGMTQEMERIDWGAGIDRWDYVNNYYIVGEGRLPTIKIHQVVRIIYDTTTWLPLDIVKVHEKVTCK